MIKNILIVILCLNISGCFKFYQDKSKLDEELNHAESQLNLTSAQVNSDEKNMLEYLPENPGLNDYIKYALLNSPALKASFYTWQASVKRIGIIRNLPEPTVSYSNYVKEVETRVGAQKNRYMVMQMLPWPGKLVSKNNIAIKEAYHQMYVYEAKRLKVIFEIKKTYYEYCYLKKSLNILTHNVELLKNIEKVMQASYSAGSTKNSSLIQMQIEISKLEERVISLKELRPAFVARINAKIGRSSNLPLCLSSIFHLHENARYLILTKSRKS